MLPRRVFLIASVATLLSLQFATAIPNGGGTITNSNPAVASGLTGDKSIENNHATVTETFTFTVSDANGEKDIAEVRVASTDATFGTKSRTVVAGDIAATSEPGSYDGNGWKVWNPTANDGVLNVKFQYAWPSGQAVGTFTQTASVRDEGSFVAGATTDSSEFRQAITVANDPVAADGSTATGARWGAWTAAPGATNVEAGNFLKITNTGATAGQQFTIDWGGTGFTGQTDAADSIAIDNNIQYAYWEDATPGTTAPNEGTYTYGSTSANGAVTITFSSIGNIVYVKYRVVAVAAAQRDQVYQQSVTATPV